MQHEPLTEQQKQFLLGLKTNPAEMTIAEVQAKGVNIDFLTQAGYIRTEQTYIGQNPLQNRYIWHWTDKPIV